MASCRSCRENAEVRFVTSLRGAHATKQSSFLDRFADARDDEPLTPADDLRHPGRRWRIAAALRAHDTVDDRHADAGQVAELYAFKNVLARRMLRLVHQHEVRCAADFDQAAIELAHPRGVAGVNA